MTALFLALVVVAVVGVGLRFPRTKAILLTIAAVVVTLDVIAVQIDFHDADGITDCWPQCSTWQHVVTWTLATSALSFVALALAATFLAFIHKR